MPGGCPNCQRGPIVENYTCCGICLAICLFPLGLTCLLLRKEKKCLACNSF